MGLRQMPNGAALRPVIRGYEVSTKAKRIYKTMTLGNTWTCDSSKIAQNRLHDSSLSTMIKECCFAFVAALCAHDKFGDQQLIKCAVSAKI
jgi:hypothetical protein